MPGVKAITGVETMPGVKAMPGDTAAPEAGQRQNQDDTCHSLGNVIGGVMPRGQETS